MNPRDKNIPRNEVNPLEMMPESVEEENLVTTLRVLVASGKITEGDVMIAWRLAFSA